VRRVRAADVGHGKDDLLAVRLGHFLSPYFGFYFSVTGIF
jgi:hypothetical protein